MAANSKYEQIIDALQKLLETNTIQNISVSDIANAAGIGKGSIYYYFSSKDEILEAMVERSYKQSIETATHLSEQTGIPAFTRMAMIFQTCRNTSIAFFKQSLNEQSSAPQRSHLHQKYMTYIITELKPALTSIIKQGIAAGDIHFDKPEELAEIVLIILTVKLDNTIVPSNLENISSTFEALVSLLEKGTENPSGSLNFLISQ